jgi:hypothetical protein
MTLQQRPLSPAEQRGRWEARAAQWRARELAEIFFGGVGAGRLLGLRAQGPTRGLLHLEVPFRDLPDHRDRERRFLEAAGSDPILSRIPLIYVLAPGAV